MNCEKYTAFLHGDMINIIDNKSKQSYFEQIYFCNGIITAFFREYFSQLLTVEIMFFPSSGKLIAKDVSRATITFSDDDPGNMCKYFYDRYGRYHNDKSHPAVVINYDEQLIFFKYGEFLQEQGRNDDNEFYVMFKDKIKHYVKHDDDDNEYYEIDGEKIYCH